MRPLLLAAVLAFLAGCSTGKDAVASGTEFVFVSPNGQTEIEYPAAERKVLPEVSGADLVDESKTLKLSDYRGKVVVVNVWGQWCGPCRTEAPEMQKLQDAYGSRGAQVLGIDVRETGRDEPRDFMKDRGINYPSIYDPSGRSLLPLKGFPRSVVPLTFVIDKQGPMAAVYLRDLLAADLEPVIDGLLKE